MRKVRATLDLIRISDATRRALAETAILPYRNTGIPVGPDLWDVPVDPEVRAALENGRRAGESDDDLVTRLLETLRNSACARDPDAEDDERIRLLLDLWGALTGD